MWYTALTFIAPLGWYWFLKNKRIAPSHVPLLICCIHILTLFVAAFAGALRWGSALLTAAGCVLLVWQAVAGKIRLSLPTPGLLVFLVGLVWAVLSTMDAVCYTWSDMSHWMRYVKALTADGGYPTLVTHPEIGYSSYPPGSALFIAHLLDHLPQTYLSGRAICAMRILQLALVSAVVSPLEKLNCHKAVRTAAALLMSALFFSLIPYNNTIMVDLLLGLFAASLLSVCLYARHRPAPLAVLLPAGMCMCLIKNSALVFLVFGALFYGVLEKGKGREGRRPWLCALLLVLEALVVFGVWTLFSRIAYPDVESSNQALSVSRFSEIFSSHAPGFYPQLFTVFFKRLLKPDLCVIIVFWGVLAMFVPAVLLGGDRLLVEHRRRLLTPALLMLLIDVLYILSLLLSYTFSFTEKEALEVASFERYFTSVLVAHAGVFLYLMLELLCALPKWQKYTGFAVVGALLTALVVAVQLLPLHDTLDRSQPEPVLSAPNDWYIRQLCSAAEERPTMAEEEQYVLWLYDRTGEPPITESYPVAMYTRIAAAACFCVPDNNVRTLDMAVNNPKDVSFVLKSFTDRENAVVVLTDPRPGALEAAQKLNIPIYYGSGVAH